METKKRTVVRMLTYRVTAWLFTILWTYLFTGDIGSATGFATALHILLSVDYYIHERIWYRHIKYGVTKVEEPIKPDLRTMDTMSTGVSETVTTTGPKRLVYTKKTG